MNHWKWFYNEWKGNFRFGFFLIFLTLLSTSVSIVFPIFFKYLIDTITNLLKNNSETEALLTRNKFILYLFVIGIIRFFGSLSPFFRAKMNFYLEKAIRKRYFDYLIVKDPSFFLKFRTGDIVTRLTDDIAGYPKVSWFACSAIFRAINSGSIVIFCILTMMWLNFKLAVITVLPLPAGIYIYLKIEKKLKKYYALNQKEVSKINNHLESCFAGIRILKIYNGCEREIERFRDVLANRLKIEMKLVRLGGMIHLFFEFLNYAAQLLVVVVGGVMIINKTLTIGEYYAFFTYLSMIVYPMIDLPHLLVTSRQAFVCVDRLEEIKNYNPVRILENGEKSVEDIEKIELENVNFNYLPHNTETKEEDNDFEMENINLTINKGETIAILGHIGAGKTTLLNLISGIIKPKSGEVKINNTSLKEYNIEDFRNKIGYIGQEPMVFSETIDQNIRFFREFSHAAVKESAHLSQFSEEISKFPNQFEQKVGQRGITISGGQKQRLTIARALIGEPQILMMDDVTASLDAENEVKFWDDVSEMFGKITSIVVTHRISTAKRADKIVIINEGKIESIGKFDDLLQSSPTFRKIAT